MKSFLKRIRKIFFLSLFAAQSIVFVVLLHEYFNAPLPYLQKPEKVENQEIFPDEEIHAITNRTSNKSHRRTIDVELIDSELKKKEKLFAQNLYLETDYDELVFDPIEKTIKDTYIYQQPKDNLAFMHALFQRADLCEEKWMDEVVTFINILDTQSAYWTMHGDSEVIAFAQVQENLSDALKDLEEETTPIHIDVVKRCYKDYEAYYFAKFNWGNDV